MKNYCLTGFVCVLVWLVAGCSSVSTLVPVSAAPAPEYVIGPGDTLQVFIWRNPEVTMTVPVRPDGKISTPLIEDLVVIGKTLAQVAREVEKRLSTYLKDPLATVIVTNFVGPYNQQVRVLGAAAKPQVLPFRASMTVLDVMIAVGGLTDLAAGNKASISRMVGTEQQQFKVRLDDLIRQGDISANVDMAPGDILIIPESWF